MNLGGPWLGKGTVPDVQRKDGEEHQVHSALNFSFVAESRMGSR